MAISKNSFNTCSALTVDGKNYRYYAINGGDLSAHNSVARLPVCTKILLENLLRHEDGVSCTRDDIEALAASAGCAVSIDTQIGGIHFLSFNVVRFW